MDSRKQHVPGKANTRVNVAEAHLMRTVIDGLIASPTPLSAISKLIAKRNSPHATPFEHYAATALLDAGARDLSRIPPRRGLQLAPPGDGHLARLLTANEGTPEENALLERVESAINRLCCVVDAVEDSGDVDDPAVAPVITISLFGGGFIPDRPGYRSAHITLPPIGRAERPSVAYLNEIDWRTLDHVAIVARNVFQRCLLPNMHQSFMGAYGGNQSDWDVRTRMAATLERLELPLRFSYRYDCDVESASAAVRFTVPSVESLPQRIADARTGRLEEVKDKANDALLAYSLRLSCLVAAACFGSGRCIERAVLYGDRADGSHALHCEFSRRGFVFNTLEAIDSGELESPELRFDPGRVAQLASPERIEIFDESDEHRFECAGFASDARRPPHSDERQLPQQAQVLFHARRICDVDTRHRYGSAHDSINEARLDSSESILAAIANLESVVESCMRETAPPDDDASAVPLYCSNPLERATVSLLDEEFAISLEAEAFLRGDSAPIGPEKLPFYFRAPDALFQAQLGLADLYARLGDFPGAESQANRCIALAPTVAQAYYQKADVLAQQDRFAEAANTIVEGLRYCASERDCALLYYHLGLVLVKLDRLADAAAVYVYAMSLAGEYAAKSAHMVQNLRKRKGAPVIAHASPLAASRQMIQARIPVAPTDEARTLVVHAAIALSCANAPEAAAPYAAAIACYFRNDPIIIATAQSLEHGIALPASRR